MPVTTLAYPFAYYATIGAALFPIPAGAKNPTGIVASFALDCSRDPAQWAAWRAANPGCNFGLVAGPSNIIIADVDVSELGRDRAWQIWAEWWQSRNLEAPQPHVQSARGGWHFFFAVPMDTPKLRQVALIGPTGGSTKAIVDLRVGNGFVVATGSFYDGSARDEASGPYILMSEKPPHVAPAALIAHCTGADRKVAPATPAIGTRDKDDVAALLRWLAERDAFSAYEDWFSVGMALKLEYGNDGLELWALTHYDTVTPEVEQTKWESFAGDPTADCVTLASWLQRAYSLGWRGSVRNSIGAMFGDAVTQMAHKAGATLTFSGETAVPNTGVPMVGRQERLTELGARRLADFLAGTNDSPTRPLMPDYPTLPASVSGHGLYVPMRDCIDRIFAIAEIPKHKASRLTDPLIVLKLMHRDVFNSATRKLRAMGCSVNDSKIKRGAEALAEEIDRSFITVDDWQCNTKTGEIENDNSDNVAVYFGKLELELRYNAWLEHIEIFGGNDPELMWREWTYVDDIIVARLRTRANRTGTRFRPGEKFFWESMQAFADRNRYDPVLDRINELQNKWDKQPRLSIWLSRVCHVPCDLYHQAVARNIIGGMVRRARRPGCKHDTTAILYGPQGTGKSTLAKIVALEPEWFSDSILLGEESKELVLLLAGKLVVEISEMGMRGSSNTAHVKAMLTRDVDEGRTAYSRAVSKRPRRNISIGTTNDAEPLSDMTGNRRFLPVHVAQEIDLDWLRANIGQIIGEAATVEASGASFDIPREIWSDAAAHAEAARSQSNMEVLFREWFAETPQTGTAFIVASDLIMLCQKAELRDSNTRRGAIMHSLGFRHERPYIGGKQSAVWFRGPSGLPKAIERESVQYTTGISSNGRPQVTVRINRAPSLVPPPVPLAAPAALPAIKPPKE